MRFTAITRQNSQLEDIESKSCLLFCHLLVHLCKWLLYTVFICAEGTMSGEHQRLNHVSTLPSAGQTVTSVLCPELLLIVTSCLLLVHTANITGLYLDSKKKLILTTHCIITAAAVSLIYSSWRVVLIRSVCLCVGVCAWGCV